MVPDIDPSNKMQAGSWLPRKQFCRIRPGGPGGQQAGQESAVLLHVEEDSQQVEGRDSSPSAWHLRDCLGGQEKR